MWYRCGTYVELYKKVLGLLMYRVSHNEHEKLLLCEIMKRGRLPFLVTPIHYDEGVCCLVSIFCSV